MPHSLRFALLRLLLGLVLLALLVLVGTNAWAIYRESVLGSVSVGMPRDQAQLILGPALQDRKERVS